MVGQKIVRLGQIFSTRLFHQLLRPKRLAILEACLIGIVSGLAAVLLGQGVGWLGGWRQHTTNLFPASIILPLIGLGGGCLAGWLVDRFAPAASGSGMSEVKAVLAAVPMPLNLRIAIVKLISAILVLGSGMPLGREGPTVQIGAALAAQLSRWFPTSPDHRRQLIAAGAGAGLAAAFDAPIAGVLFVVEELLQDVSGITLGTAILSSFIASVVARIYGTHSLDLDLRLESSNTSFAAGEIPFYLILGILAGLLGVVFNRGVLQSLNFNCRVLRVSLPWRVGLAGLVAGFVLVLLPDFRDNAGLRQILLAGEADWQQVALAFLLQFLLILITYGSGAPGGLLVPSLVLGAALGYLIGVWEHSWLGFGTATTYARAGMGAFFSAVARVPITGIIIVFEMTTDFNLVLPLMIGSVTAYLVAESISAGSLYDLLLEWKGIHLAPEATAQGLWAELKAAGVMQPKVETLSSRMSLDEALQAFSQSSHRNFPIVEQGKLVGILTQKDLASTAQRQLKGDTAIDEIMTPEPITVRPGDTLAHVLHLLNRCNLSCLPVTEGRRLVGIITRSDIIRAEALHLQGETEQLGSKPEPSYVIFQSRVPATGRGRILVLLSNPKTAPTLLKMALAIARDRHYEIECLHAIVVPRHYTLAEAPVNLAASQQLLEQAVQMGQAWQVPVHTQIRVTYNLAGAILETVKDRHIDLTLMGWKGSTVTPGRVFSRVVDTAIRQAACEVILVKLSDKEAFDRWLLPMAGGPNAQAALQLLPALVSLSKAPQVKLCQVFAPGESTDSTMLEAGVRFLQSRLNGKATAHTVCGDSIPKAVTQFAQANNTDVIILGASREGMLQQAIEGNIPAAIARHSNCSTILVRGASV